jgi:putative sugar O-methyltransferase
MNRIRFEKQITQLLCRKVREYRNDSNFNLNLVECGFQDQPCNFDDETAIQRIIKAYNKSKLIQRSAGPAFQVSNEWLPIYEKPLKKIMAALKNEDIGDVRRQYHNFMRDDCSTGLHGLPVDMNKLFFSGNISNRNKKRFLCDSIHRYHLWKSLLGDTHTVRNLVAPCIGNPYGSMIDGVFVRTGADYLHYYATVIARLIRKSERRIVVELGGGYGGMAYYLCRDNQNFTYVDFDLPENMALTAYYLLNALPKHKVLLFGEAELTPQIVNEYDIIIMPSFEIMKLQDKSVDVIFNSYSLAEMSAETITTYIHEFMRVNKGYILHVNHNKDSEVVADNFGIDPTQFDLIYKIPAQWNGGRNLNMDEYEYLYKRIQ